MEQLFLPNEKTVSLGGNTFGNIAAVKSINKFISLS